MERLNKENRNTAKEYNQIFLDKNLQPVDSQEINRWKKLIKHYKGGRLIDLGTLDSLVPQLAHEQFPQSEIWAIDIANVAIEQMRRKYPYIYYEVRNVYDTKFPDNYFAYVVAGELLEHLEDPKRFIPEAMRILKHGGTFALSIPLEETIGAVDKIHHIWSFSRQDIQELLEPYGRITWGVMRSSYFPIYKYHFPVLLAYVQKA